MLRNSLGGLLPPEELLAVALGGGIDLQLAVPRDLAPERLGAWARQLAVEALAHPSLTPRQVQTVGCAHGLRESPF